MGLPVAIKEFTKNPISTVAVLAMAGMIYLYIDLREMMVKQEKYFLNEIEMLRAENKELQSKYIELAKSIK
mgnify:CR=1 FL=1